MIARLALRPRLEVLEAARVNAPANFWRAPQRWQCLGILLENGAGAMRAAAELVAAGDHAGLAALLELAVPRTNHDVPLTPARLAWAAEAITRESKNWRAAAWWGAKETLFDAAAWLASVAPSANPNLNRVDEGSTDTPAALARTLLAELARQLADLENQQR